MASKLSADAPIWLPEIKVSGGDVTVLGCVLPPSRTLLASKTHSVDGKPLMICPCCGNRYKNVATIKTHLKKAALRKH
jgi:hypothetical protein